VLKRKVAFNLATTPYCVIQGCGYELQVFKDAAIATMAENHHLRLSAARNFKNCTSATLVILLSPTK
jgi:hypothetical protein